MKNFYCKEHKRSFRYGAGLACHMRSPRFHPKGGSPPNNNGFPRENAGEHLAAAIACIDGEIAELRAHRERIEAAYTEVVRQNRASL